MTDQCNRLDYPNYRVAGVCIQDGHVFCSSETTRMTSGSCLAAVPACSSRLRIGSCGR